jgi:glucokinase
VVANLVSLAEKLAQQAKAGQLLALGVGFAGVLDKERAVVIKSPNLPGWESFNLKAHLSQRLNSPVVLENDANAAAMGEKWRGAAKGLDNFMLITLGTGVGSGIVLKGELWLGESGQGGEFGHTKVVRQGQLCNCGDRGCLEAYVSGKAITRMAKRAIKQGKYSLLGRLKAIDAEKVQQAAQAGDKVALGVYRAVGGYLGLAIANVVNLLDITQFVLGGSISNAYPLLLPGLMGEMDKQLLGGNVRGVEIIKAQCQDAGVCGSAHLALIAAGSSPASSLNF